MKQCFVHQVYPPFSDGRKRGERRAFKDRCAQGRLGACGVIAHSDGKDVVRLAKHPKVVAIKEAAGSVDRVSAIKNALPDFTVLSGDDSLTVPMISVGAEGVISVASNVIPREMSDMVRFALAGDFVKAREYHAKYYELFRDLFIDVNPVMVKEALSLTGAIERVFRLPLCETDDAKLERMKKTLQGIGLL
jgi:4-hydroxy-tetrahydrodipicolinate synthase